MIGLVLLILAELADVVTSVAGMESGRTVEANSLLPHDVGGLVLAKLYVLALLASVWPLTSGRPSLRRPAEVAYLVCSGVLLAVAAHNLGVIA